MSRFMILIFSICLATQPLLSQESWGARKVIRVSGGPRTLEESQAFKDQIFNFPSLPETNTHSIPEHQRRVLLIGDFGYGGKIQHRYTEEWPMAENKYPEFYFATRIAADLTHNPEDRTQIKNLHFKTKQVVFPGEYFIAKKIFPGCENNKLFNNLNFTKHRELFEKAKDFYRGIKSKGAVGDLPIAATDAIDYPPGIDTSDLPKIPECLKRADPSCTKSSDSTVMQFLKDHPIRMDMCWQIAIEGMNRKVFDDQGTVFLPALDRIPGLSKNSTPVVSRASGLDQVVAMITTRIAERKPLVGENYYHYGIGVGDNTYPFGIYTKEYFKVNLTPNLKKYPQIKTLTDIWDTYSGLAVKTKKSDVHGPFANFGINIFLAIGNHDKHVIGNQITKWDDFNLKYYGDLKRIVITDRNKNTYYYLRDTDDKSNTMTHYMFFDGVAIINAYEKLGKDAAQAETKKQIAYFLENRSKNPDPKKTNWYVAVNHYPFISSSKNDELETREMLQNFVCDNFDVYLAGHEHKLEMHVFYCGAGRGKNIPQPVIGSGALQRPIMKQVLEKIDSIEHEGHQPIFASGRQAGFAEMVITCDAVQFQFFSEKDDEPTNKRANHLFTTKRYLKRIGQSFCK